MLKPRSFGPLPQDALRRDCVSTGQAWMQRLGRDAGPEILSLAGLDRDCLRSAKMARVEAVLLVSGGALSARRIATLATLADHVEAKRTLDQLNTAYDKSGSPFRIERQATGYQLLTRPPFALWLGKLHHREQELKLTPPAMETLTIVAYRQPITRADLEEIRGVQCTEMLKMLMERGLVRIAGEDDSLGRPFLYGTTRKFLEMYALKNLDDLPLADELRKPKAAVALQAAETDADEEAATSAA